MKKTKFGLRKKGSEKLIKVREEKIKSSRGINTYYVLNEEVGEEWLIDSLEEAIKAKESKKKWYEGTYKKPSHEYNDLEIVEITKIEIIEIKDTESKKEEIKEEKKTNEIEKTDFTIRITTEEVPKEEKELKREEERKEKVENQNIATKTKTDTIKMIVLCKRTMYEQHGKIIMSNQPKTILFEEGTDYLSYIKDDEVYVISESKTPEYFCKMTDKGMEDSTLFDMYFDIKELKH